MKLLLDENLPKRLKYRSPDSFEIKAVPEMNWGGIKNGDLLKKMNAENLNILITMDKNFSHQQNLTKYSVSFIVLNAKDSRYDNLLKFIPKILITLKSTLEPGVFKIE